MNVISIWFLLVVGLFLSTGCGTTESWDETKTIPWGQQQAYLKKVRDPRIFGMNLYQTRSGVEVRGGGRVHNWQSEVLDMKAGDPLRPVVGVMGNFGMESSVLLDLVSPLTWLEFNLAMELGAEALAEKDPILIRLPGEEVAACLSTMTALRLGQLHIENPLVYVRLATGSIGPLARDIRVPQPKGVIGWDLLHKFEQIQFLYSSGKVALSAIEPYEPNPSLVVATLPIVKNAGACMVKAKVNGAEMLVAVDPAGDFAVATPKGVPVSSLELGGELTLSNPEVSTSPGGVRIGARVLQNYHVSICPKLGEIYLEGLPKDVE